MDSIFGRPSKYSPEVTQKVIDYYALVRAQNGKIPYIEELSLDLDIDDDTINEWCRDREKRDFSAAIKRIKTLQRLRLLEATMQKERSRGAMFQLRANHNLSETYKFSLDNEQDKINEGLDLLRKIIKTGEQERVTELNPTVIQ